MSDQTDLIVLQCTHDLLKLLYMQLMTGHQLLHHLQLMLVCLLPCRLNVSLGTG